MADELSRPIDTARIRVEYQSPHDGAGYAETPPVFVNGRRPGFSVDAVRALLTRSIGLRAQHMPSENVRGEGFVRVAVEFGFRILAAIHGFLKATVAGELVAADEAATDPGEPLEAPTKPPESRPNFLVVLTDTVRSDRLGCLGYELDTTPRIDELASRSALFTQARAQGPRTPLSMPSIMTGLYHSEIAANRGFYSRVYEDNVFISEILRDVGYSTWAISSFIYYLPENGFAQGFDEFDTELHTLRRPIRRKPTSDLVTDRTLAQIDSLKGAGESPFFVLAHYADAHRPYIHHKGFAGFGRSRSRRYAGEIRFVDHHVGRLLDGIRERGLEENTIVIVAADHGEALSEKKDHGVEGHGQNLYDEQIRVPLIIHVPSGTTRVIDQPVGLIDLAPTIVDLAGIPSEQPFSGNSLLPLLAGEFVQRPPVYSERRSRKRRTEITMVQWPYKLHMRAAGKKWRLFNLAEDPHELKDISKKEPDVSSRMVAEARQWRSKLSLYKE